MGGVTEVKKDDTNQGIAQCAVLLESAIYVNRVNLMSRHSEGLSGRLPIPLP